MRPITVTKEELDDVYKRRRQQWRNFRKYGRPGTRQKKYPMYYDTERYKWVLDKEKIEHNFHLRCQGCDEEIKQDEYVMLIDLGGSKVVCHDGGCLYVLNQKKPHLLKKDVDRYEDFDVKVATWISDGILMRDLRQRIQKDYDLSYESAHRRLHAFLKRHKGTYSVKVRHLKGRGKPPYWIQPISNDSKGLVVNGDDVDEYERPPSPYRACMGAHQ